ncbi:MAG: biopolymer transporter ExbD [Bacteroidetes bacterium GWA2_31_9]|nr:MAG: biopolymer transporter ExbD [Bacteroidetes bacterium GWA2_31_9]
MGKREVPEINAGSMADIAFLLLIFFLVTTTMDVDSGLSRMLPPIVPPEQQKDDSKIKERNIFVVLVNRDNRLLVEGEPMKVKQLRKKAKEFIANPKNDEDLPEKKATEIPFFGTYPVSKQIISLQNDRGTAYGTYIAVQNELVAAYNELRDELAMQKFGKKFDDLNKEQANAIKDIYPQRISEAEPKNIGGNQ